MRNWAIVSAAVAPIALIGGWTWAQTRQSGGFDPMSDTISALAAQGAQDRWIMTAGLLVLGICHLVTAAGLPEAGRWGRLLLATGGLATIVVAAAPQPAAAHSPSAAAGFVALALWPAFSRLPRRAAGIAATVVLLVLLGWLGMQIRGGDALGLSERILAGAQAFWPLIVVVAVGVQQRRLRRPGPEHPAGAGAGSPPPAPPVG